MKPFACQIVTWQHTTIDSPVSVAALVANSEFPPQNFVEEEHLDLAAQVFPGRRAGEALRLG
jgi:hypothetical protein